MRKQQSRIMEEKMFVPVALMIFCWKMEQEIQIVKFLFVLICSNLYGKKGPVTNLELPRFVSLKSDDVNLRVGPSMNYPIELKYTQNNLPIEVIDEFDVWRDISLINYHHSKSYH